MKRKVESFGEIAGGYLLKPILVNLCLNRVCDRLSLRTVLALLNLYSKLSCSQLKLILEKLEIC